MNGKGREVPGLTECCCSTLAHHVYTVELCIAQADHKASPEAGPLASKSQTLAAWLRRCTEGMSELPPELKLRLLRLLLSRQALTDVALG